MPTPLTDRQRQLAHHVLLFDRPLASEVAEALQRATLACAENKVASTGFLEFFCGLYLQFGQELQFHFEGNAVALLEHTFPKHRFGNEGLVTETVLENAASDTDSSFGYSVVLSDDLLRLLWTATRLADAVGRKTSLKDVIAAITLENAWLEELRRNGIVPDRKLHDFKDVLNVVFFRYRSCAQRLAQKGGSRLGREDSPTFYDRGKNALGRVRSDENGIDDAEREANC